MKNLFFIITLLILLAACKEKETQSKKEKINEEEKVEFHPYDSFNDLDIFIINRRGCTNLISMNRAGKGIMIKGQQFGREDEMGNFRHIFMEQSLELTEVKLDEVLRQLRIIKDKRPIDSNYGNDGLVVKVFISGSLVADSFFGNHESVVELLDILSPELPLTYYQFCDVEFGSSEILDND